MPIALNHLDAALSALEVALRVAGRAQTAADTELADTARSGVIQNFEIAYELSWKVMRRWLLEELGHTDTELAMRRQLYRLAAQHGLIDDLQAWMDFHQARNLTSHTYDRGIALQVAAAAADFVSVGRSLLRTLQTLSHDPEA